MMDKEKLAQTLRKCIVDIENGRPYRAAALLLSTVEDLEAPAWGPVWWRPMTDTPEIVDWRFGLKDVHGRIHYLSDTGEKYRFLEDVVVKSAEVSVKHNDSDCSPSLYDDDSYSYWDDDPYSYWNDEDRYFED